MLFNVKESRQRERALNSTMNNVILKCPLRSYVLKKFSVQTKFIAMLLLCITSIIIIRVYSRLLVNDCVFLV